MIVFSSSIWTWRIMLMMTHLLILDYQYLVISQLEREVITLLTWVINNRLKANPDKFHLVHSDNSQKSHIKDADLHIKNSQAPKLLEIKTDNKLTLDQHVCEICINYIFSRIFQFMFFNRRKEFSSSLDVSLQKVESSIMLFTSILFS